ncbi:hypothetical protein ABK040_005861 [Willaertia magna]
MSRVQEEERKRLAAIYGGDEEEEIASDVSEDEEEVEEEEETHQEKDEAVEEIPQLNTSVTKPTFDSTVMTPNTRRNKRKELFGGAFKKAIKDVIKKPAASFNDKPQKPSKFSSAVRVWKSVKEMHSRMQILLEDYADKIDLEKAIQTQDIILNQDDLFEGAGESAGLQIWQLVKMIPVEVPEEAHGKFARGDCYICVYSYETGNDEDARLRKLHYWVGKNADVMKQAICTFLAHELANRIGASIYREEEREEGEEFLEYFDHHVEYIDGCATWDTLKKLPLTERNDRLLKVCADHRKRILVKRVPLSKKELENSMNDVYLLETDNDGGVIYVWIGSEASKTQQLKAFDVARNLIHEDRKGKGKVEIINQNEEPQDFWKVFDEFGQNTNKVDSTQDSFVIFSVEVVSVEEKQYNIEKLEIQDLTKDILEDEKVYLLETKHEIYLWYGKRSKFVDRKCAEKLAESLRKSSDDIKGIYSCFSGAEPVLFRERFKGGFYYTDTPNEFEKKRRNLCNICSNEYVQPDISITLEEFQYKEKLDYVDQEDEGGGTVQIWRVIDSHYAEPVPEEELGNFYSEDCYLILYEFNRGDMYGNPEDDEVPEEEAPQEEEIILPTATAGGYESDDSDSLEARLKLIDSMGVKVTEVKEEEQTVKKAPPKEEEKPEEPEQPLIKPLNIKKKKIHYLPRRILYCWEGSESKEVVSSRVLKRNFQHFASDPVNPATIVTLKEGKENEHFMKIFEHIMVIHKGSLRSKRKPQPLLYRIYCKTVANSKAVEVERKRVNLNSNDVFVLVGPNTAYVWVGNLSSGKKKEIAFKLTQSIIPGEHIDVTAIDEGFECEEFWDLLGENNHYQYVTDKLNYSQGVVFECSVTQDLLNPQENVLRVMSVGEVGQQFLQPDLVNTHQVLILDYTDVLFVWYPSTPSKASRQMSLNAVAYILKADLNDEMQEDEENGVTEPKINNTTLQFIRPFEGEAEDATLEIPRFPRSVLVYEVERGMEPPSFRSGFPIWREEKPYIDVHEERLRREKDEDSKLISKSLPFLQIVREKYPFLITNDEFVNVHNMVHIIKLARLCKNNYDMLFVAMEQLEEEYKEVIDFGDYFEEFAGDLFKFVVTNRL